MFQQATLPLAPPLPQPALPWANPSETREFERRFERAQKRQEPVVLADPYAPAAPERQRELREQLRRVLEVLARVDGLSVSLTTRSPLIAQDAERLAELDSHHALSVRMVIPAVDADLSHLLDPHGAPPADRFYAVERLAARGLHTVVVTKPLMPWVNAEERALRPLFVEAEAAGAADVEAHALTLRPASRERLMPFLREHFPELSPIYRRLYGHRDDLSQRDRDRLLTVFRALRMEFGFPKAVVGRG